MKSNFYDNKLIKIVICFILIIFVIGLLLNRLYICKFINQNDDENNNIDSSYNVTADGLYNYYVCDNNSAREIYITKYNGEEKSVIIQNMIDDVVVTQIGDSCFTMNDEIVSVQIPNTITHIGTCAFAGCKNLKSVTIPDSVKTIDPYVFVDSDNVTIYSFENSFAINYAKEYSIKYNLKKIN